MADTSVEPDSVYQIQHCDNHRQRLGRELKKLRSLMKGQTGDKRKEYKRKVHKLEGQMYAFEDRRKTLQNNRRKPASEKSVKENSAAE